MAGSSSGRSAASCSRLGRSFTCKSVGDPACDSSLGKCEEWPPFGHALEDVRAAVGYGDLRSDELTSDGLGDEHFTWPREIADAFGNRHRETENVVRPDLDLSGVDPRAYVDAQRSCLGHDLTAARTAPRGGVEGREDPVAGVLHQAASVPVQRCVDHPVVRIHERGPLAVTEPRGVLGRRDDVGEQDRRKGYVPLGEPCDDPS